MSLFSRRYGGNKANCDLYIVDAIPEENTGLFYMYSPEEWLEHIKNKYGDNWENNIESRGDIHGEGSCFARKGLFEEIDGKIYGGTAGKNKYPIAAYAIVTEDYQFLFSPTEFIGPTYAALSNTSIKGLTNNDVIGSDLTYWHYPYFKYVNFNVPYLYCDDADTDHTGRTYLNQQNRVQEYFDKLNDSDGYENTTFIDECFYDTGTVLGLYDNWIDSSISIYSSVLPDASINEVYGGPYVISSDAPPTTYRTDKDTWPFTWKIFPTSYKDRDIKNDIIDPYQRITNDTEGNSWNSFPGFDGKLNDIRLRGWGIFPDTTYGFIELLDKFYIPSKNELKLIIKNVLTAHYDKQWFDNKNSMSSLYSNSTTKEIEKLLKCGTSLSLLRKPFRRTDTSKGIDRNEYISDLACLWEDIPFGGSGSTEFFWTSTPYSYTCYPYSQNQMGVSLSMIVAKHTSYVEDVADIEDTEEYIKYPSGFTMNGDRVYNYYIFDKHEIGYKSGYNSSSNPGRNYKINEGKLIACARIPKEVVWAPEYEGRHPEIKRF